MVEDAAGGIVEAGAVDVVGEETGSFQGIAQTDGRGDYESGNWPYQEQQGEGCNCS